MPLELHHAHEKVVRDCHDLAALSVVRIELDRAPVGLHQPLDVKRVAPAEAAPVDRDEPGVVQLAIGAPVACVEALRDPPGESDHRMGGIDAGSEADGIRLGAQRLEAREHRNLVVRLEDVDARDPAVTHLQGPRRS